MYEFKAEPNNTFTYANRTFFENETYTFQTEDFENYSVTDKTGTVFQITADQFFDADVMDNITVTQADYDCTAAMVQHFANHDASACSHAYGDIAVKHEILLRVPYGEETLRFLDEAQSIADADGAEFSYGDGKLIDEDNELFNYLVCYDAQTDSLKVLRIYQYDQMSADITEDQLAVLYDKAENLYRENIEDRKSPSKYDLER